MPRLLASPRQGGIRVTKLHIYLTIFCGDLFWRKKSKGRRAYFGLACSSIPCYVFFSFYDDPYEISKHDRENIQVAIETNQSVIIVDGQTGHVLHTFTVPGQSSAFASSGVMPLASRFPASGGPGLRGIAWSPDGSQIAASFFGDVGASLPETPAVLVWNLQTGALSRLLLRSNNDIDGALGSVGWSSNGEYLAAETSQGVVVWKVATRQIILQKNTGSLPDVNPALAWQPGTLNLAQIGVVKAGSGYTTAILIFDGTTGKMLKQLVVPVNDVLAWSPDGKYLAYTSSADSPADVEKGNTAQILDASTWRVVYTYKDNTNMIKGLVWSPNGHFIATGESFIENNTVAGVVRVWVALD